MPLVHHIRCLIPVTLFGLSANEMFFNNISHQPLDLIIIQMNTQALILKAFMLCLDNLPSWLTLIIVISFMIL